MKQITRIAVFIFTATISGCAVGPDFRRPDAPKVNAYTAAPLPAQTVSSTSLAGTAQRFIQDGDIDAQWWTAFGSAALNELVNSALLANPDLKSAEAALRVAQENIAAQRGAYFPSLDIELNPTRQKIANTLASPAQSGATFYSLHTAQLNIAYVPDVFGANRRQIEGLVAEADVQRFQREAVYMTLTANIVNAAIQEASIRAQINATRNLVDLSAQLLDISRRQKAAGQIGGADVVAQESTLAQAQASIPPLEKQLAQQRNLLTVLAGRLPSEEISQRFELSSLSLPVELPLSLPSHLVEQRPDIRAAEAQLHAASAQVGVAIAARLPSITLTANIGSSALEFSKLFGSGGFWFVGADIIQPVFRGGALMHKQKTAEAAYEQATAQYQSTVLTAFQNTADTLQAIVSDAETLRATAAAEAAARKSLVLARQKHELGAASTTDLIVAQQAYQQAISVLVQAQASRYADTVALFQALGGGWWHSAQAANNGT